MIVEWDTDYVYPVHEDIFRLSYSGLWQMDSYLSPMTMKGWQVEVGNEWWQRFRRYYRWHHMGQIQFVGGQATAPRGGNRTHNLGGSAGWGAHYVWEWPMLPSEHLMSSSWQVLMGPYLNFDLMTKELSKNVNKPYSFDVGLDIELMAGVQYRFRAGKTSYRIGYLVRYNILGLEWLPDYWSSYYEITEKVRIKESIQPTYFVNRQHLNEQLTMDLSFPNTCWRLGIRHEYLHYGKADNPYARQSVSAVIGYLFNYSAWHRSF